MSEEDVVRVSAPATTIEHYLETESKTNSGMMRIPGLMSLVNDSLFVAHVRFPDYPVFVAEYPARVLIVHTIWGVQERDGRWRHQIRLRAHPAPYLDGLNTCGDSLQYQIFPEANYQHIFRASLIWTVGYFRTAERDFEMRRPPE